MNPIEICHRCEHRERDNEPRSGHRLCLIEPRRPFIEHIQAGKCPIGRFELSAEELAKLFPPAPPAVGPGTELTAMLKLIVDDESCSMCGLRAAQMNAWGVAGCREHRTEIIDWLMVAANERGWMVKIQAGVRARRHCLPLSIGGLVDEAIRRAEDDVS